MAFTDQDFLSKSQKVLFTKETVEKADFIKMKNLFI